MNWNFTGAISSKRLLPRHTGYYQIKLDSWYFDSVLDFSMRSDLNGARKTAEIMELGEARDILLNMMERGEKLLNKSTNANELSFLQYRHDPTERIGNQFSVVIGLDAQTLLRISENLDQALLSKNPVRISCYAGFSEMENNPNSIQPTFAQFEAGEILPLMQPAQLTLHRSTES